MKLVKIKRYIVVVFLLWATLVCTAQIYLFTPKGSIIVADATDIVDDWTETEKLDAREDYMTKKYEEEGAVILADISLKYNCHSYAWNMAEGGPECWLNDRHNSSDSEPNILELYWEDGSYEETTEEYAEKIYYHYAPGGHSAIKSMTHPGMYVSKWGDSFLMLHPDTLPFKPMPERTFYRKCVTGSYANETINATRLIHGYVEDKRIITGCEEMTVGNVVIQPGAEVAISASRKIILTSGFHAKEGSRVVITTAPRGPMWFDAIEGEWCGDVPGVGYVDCGSSTSKSAVVAGNSEEPVLAQLPEVIEDPFPISKENPPRLGQNHPNPFTGETVIPYYLPEGSAGAWLRIINTNGIVVQTVTIAETGESAITLEAHALPPGIYVYSLLINGQVIDAKRMVVE